MQDLINELVQKAGLSEASAKKAIDTTLGFIKGKLPPMFADKIDDIVNGKFDLGAMFGGGGKSDSDSPLDKLKDMF